MNKITYRACLFNCLLLIGIPLIPYLVLNSSGFCFAKMRYLSNEDKIRSVFKYQSERTDLLYRVNIEPSSNKYIKYESFDKYLQENPDCCTINPGSPYDIPPPSIWYPIFGFPSGDVVVINFKVRYLDENGKQRAEEIRFENLVTNCGKVY